MITYPSTPVPADQTPARTPGEQRRRDLRHRAALRRELDAAVAAFNARYPDVWTAPVPF